MFEQMIRRRDKKHFPPNNIIFFLHFRPGSLYFLSSRMWRRKAATCRDRPAGKQPGEAAMENPPDERGLAA
jgi:hypothetical protein